MRNWLLIWALLIPVLGIGQDQIKRVEYFYDVDPGFGNGTALTFVPGTEVSISTALDLSGVSPGLHVAYLRAENDSGWSMTLPRPFVVVGGANDPNIVELEYFIDVDPGYGNGTSLATTASAATAEAFTVDLTGQAPGLHTLYVRAKNENLIWSQVLARAFSVTGDGGVAMIDRLEYFFDEDPGYGNGIEVDLADDVVVSENINFDLSGLAAGIHIVNMRARNTNGVWSHNFARPFLQIGTGSTPNATAVEYFFDEDPGFGNGNPLDIVDGVVVAEDLTFSLAGLSSGIHVVYVRAMNQNGTWSQTFTRAFLKTGGEVVADLVGIEYSLDSDPGFGNGIYQSVSDSPVSIDSLTIGLDTEVSEGLHLLYIRAINDDGVWSQTFVRPFFKTGSAVYPTITGIEYFFDVDPGFGNGTFVAVDSAASTATFEKEIYDVAGLANGVHLVYTRAQDENGKWSETYSRPFIVTGKKALEDVVEIEYFIDSVGQWGTGRNFQFNPKVLIDTNFIADVSGYNAGTHRIFFRAKNSEGAWSHFIEEEFCIGPGARFASDTVCFMNFTTFMNTTTATTDSTQYRWDYNIDGTIDDSTEYGIQWHYGEVGVHQSMIIAWNDSACVDTAIYDVLVDSIGDIMGTVFTDEGPIVAGGVEIFRYRPVKGKWVRVDSISVDSMGQYHLRNVPKGDYIIRAKGDTTLYGEYITSYYDSTYKWVSANIITTLCDTVVDIGLLEASFVFGDGTISGTITQEITFQGAKTGKVLGDPIPGIDVSLEQVPGGVVAAQTTTDEDGLYQFDNLPPTGFQIYVDIPGLGMEETYQIQVTEEDTVFEELDFIVDSTAIFIDYDSTAVDPGDTTTGGGNGGGKIVVVPGDTDPNDTTYIGNNPLDTTVIESVGEIAAHLHRMLLYPNPFQDQFSVVLDMKRDQRGSLTLTNMLGEVIYRKESLSLSKGRNTIEFSQDVLSHKTGIFFLNLEIDGAFLNKSLVRIK